MADNEEGFSVQGESLGRIGRVVREVETNSGIGPPEQRRKRGLRSILEGVFTEDLAACDDPNVPTTAKFQIKTLVRADNSWANEDSPSIVPVLNRSPSSWAEGDYATIEELYTDKYFVRPGVSSGAQIINFLIASADPATRSALVSVVTRSFNGPLYGALVEDDVVRVYDTNGCHLTENSEQLFNRRGDAVLMLVNDAVIETHFADVAYPPQWYWKTQFVCCASTICLPAS